MSQRTVAFVALLTAQAIAPARTVLAGPEIRSVLSVLDGASALDRFRRPVALAADPSRGIFLVGDTGNHRLVVFDSSGRTRGSISLERAATPGAIGATNGENAADGAAEPRALALDSRGRVYVVDALTRDVEVLTPFGAHIAFVRPPLPEGVGDQAQVQSIAVGGSGRVYLLYGGARPGLVVTDPTGAALLTLGFEPAGEGPFVGPVSVAVNDDETEIAVVDPEAERAILVRGADGSPLAAFGRHGEGEGTFSVAVHAAWGPDGTLWIVDTVRQSVVVFDDRGTYLGRIGGFGAGPGQFNYPAACAFLAPDKLVVLERANDRCQILEVAMEESGTPIAASQPAAPDGAEPATTLRRR